MPPETYDGLRVNRIPETHTAPYPQVSGEKKCPPKSSRSFTFASLFRKLLLGLLNAASPERRFLKENPTVPAPVYDIVDAGPDHRFTTAAHTAHNCLGLGYGCGKDKFVLVAKILAGLDISLQESEKVVNDFRNQNPKITGLWRRLQAALVRAASEPDRTLTLKLPSGNTLVYRDVRNTGNGSYDALVCKQGRMLRVKLYGGLLTENLVQSVARDIFALGLLEVDAQGIPLVLQTHDEAVTELPEQFDTGIVVTCLAKPPVWMPDIPLAAEASEGTNYCLK